MRSKRLQGSCPPTPTLLMDEARQQRWLSGVILVVGVVAIGLEFRSIPASDRGLGLALIALGLVVGFGIMFARDRHLRRTGKRPLDRPSSAAIFALALFVVGLTGLVRLMPPVLRVLALGIVVGLILGFFVYIGQDVNRLRPTASSENSDNV